MSLMLCEYFLYCDMSQLIVLLAFGNASGLNEFTNLYLFCYILQLNLMLDYFKFAFLMLILQYTTRSEVQIQSHYTK